MPDSTKDTFRRISPEDMTKLKQVIEMLRRSSAYYACQIVASIAEPTARSVGDALIGLGAPVESRQYAEHLRAETLSLLSKLERTKATDADLEREISSVELAEFIREEWCYERTGDPQDEAVNQILARLCRRFELREPTDG